MLKVRKKRLQRSTVTVRAAERIKDTAARRTARTDPAVRVKEQTANTPARTLARTKDQSESLE